MATWLQHGAAAWRPRPVKRVFIPKAGRKAARLGIPVIADRALQALTSAALEPEWEARFESRSYGFRPGRGCQDAMQAVFVTARGKTCKRVWALDADLAAAFDHRSLCLLDQLGTFPARDGRAWLKSGVIDRGRFAPTEQGSPQGGVISPVLMNVALHGMEEAAGVRYITTGSNRDGETEFTYADPLRQRRARPVPLAWAGRAGPGAAGRVAGDPGSGLQRGQDPHRPPR